MDPSCLVDVVLDRTVVAGYGRSGLWARRALPGWPADPPRMEGMVVAVTGAGGGLGLAAARGFADLGAHVHLIGRDGRRIEQATAHLLREVPGASATAQLCDVSSLESLRAFCDGWSGPLDVLVNNAGVMAPTRRLTADGVELTFATNVLGPFVLTQRLAALTSRIVNVSSGGMYGQRLNADHLQNDDTYSPVMAYARSKRAEVILTQCWAERLQNVAVHAMHPGWANTPGITTSLPRFGKLAKPVLRTPEQGADTIVWLGAAPEPGQSSGLFWQDRRPRPTYLFGLNKETPQARQALWDLCEHLAA